FINIDEMKQTEQHLADALDLLEKTYINAPAGLCVLNEHLQFVRINPMMAEINGIPLEQHLGQHVFDLLPGLRQTLEPVFRQVIATGTALTSIEVTGTTPAAPDVIRYWIASYYPV
ncbi:PAS domain-containing protein, partial [Haemophilus parainfluenzae]|uniref:PAS domain-containing protein n=1 Tax=Haemophilus parainfluenzae TaxID=729 RepID=UPI00124B8B2B